MGLPGIRQIKDLSTSFPENFKVLEKIANPRKEERKREFSVKFKKNNNFYT